MKGSWRDLFIYIAIGVGIVIVGTLWVFLVPERFWPHLTFTWFSFIFFTAIFAAVLAKVYWPKRRMLKLWLLLGLLMAIHTLAYIILLNHVEQWSALWFVLTMPIELMLFGVIVKVCLNVMPAKVGIW